MRYRLLKIDAFAHRPLTGNPAAVMPLDAWLPDALMQRIAAENNQSETAFFVAQGEGYGLRWFTPNVEVALCGHATLAAGDAVFRFLKPEAGLVRFETESGTLTVEQRAGGLLVMNFPATPPRANKAPEALVKGLGRAPIEALAGPDHIAVYEDAATVRALKPDLALLETLDLRAVVATAPGEGGVDYVLRFFAPKNAVPEDPVTGNAQTALAPFWAKRLGKNTLDVRQLSARGGAMTCALVGDRVEIAGRCALYLDGMIEV
ncbi:MAG: PhzF family phenazine biosynthesis protein [Alphaproteobacteria bacterium]|nr:PhzF family phenazine biosynthesis protein [Alphaproteobacteria bacterium]